MAHIFAVANQKGGVGKTTSTVNLAAEAASNGRRVLVIDLDPQGSATSGLGIAKEENREDLYDLFVGACRFSDLPLATGYKDLSLVPNSRDLISLELEIGKKPGRELILRAELGAVRHHYDYVFIDCPPSSGLLTLNALGCASGVLIPLQAEYYALEGLSQLVETIEFVKNTFNVELSIFGVFMTMFDARTNLSFQVEREAREFFGDALLKTRIPRTVRISEAPSFGKPVRYYDSASLGAKAYASLTQEIISRAEAETLKAVGA